MLISVVMPVMSIYKLPHGQYGYSGHIINLPQDVKLFATKLPHVPVEIDILVVRKEREQTHRDFYVRRRVVEDALTLQICLQDVGSGEETLCNCSSSCTTSSISSTTLAVEVLVSCILERVLTMLVRESLLDAVKVFVVVQ